MNLTRRGFIKLTGAGLAASSVGALGFGYTGEALAAATRPFKLAATTETRNTCPYCSVACGVIIYSKGDLRKGQRADITHIEGDADHPTNRGTLCPKGSSLYQDILNDRRLLRPEVRRPGSDRWEPIPWDQAFEEIGRHIKSARDESFVATDAKGRTVNRCENIAFIGGCTDTNEFNYLVVKTMRSLGVTFIENQARV